jgi:hypothetical protein
MRRLRSWITYGNVVATMALVGVLGGGGAYAASLIGSKQIAPGAVASKHIRDGRVKTVDLASGSVTEDKILFDAVSEGHVQADAIGSSELMADSVGLDELKLAVHTNQVNVAANATANVTAPCSGGEIPIAGGGGFAGVPAGTLATTERANGGWYVEGKNTSGGVATLIVQAVCVGA